MGGLFSGQRWKRIATLVGIALILFGAGYAGYQLFLNQKTVTLLPKKGETVTFVESGIPERYAMSEGNLLKRMTESYRQTNIVTYEHLASPFSEDERVALAIAPDIKGTVLGIFKADDSLDILVSGETNKSDLLVTEGGIAVYSAQKIVDSPVVAPVPEVVGADRSEDTKIETGHAGPPANLVASAAKSGPNVGVGELYAVNIKTGKIRPLGSGRSPRLLPDGSVLALAHEGVVLVNPLTGVRTVLLQWPGADGILGGISKSGNMIAVAGSDGQSADFFRLEKGSAYTLAHIGRFDKKTGAKSLAFIDDSRFFVRESAQLARLFSVPTEKLPIAVPSLLVGISQ